jgi:hypothetical protein
MDHNWGPHMKMLFSEKDWKAKDDVDQMLRKNLPFEFMGFPTNFTKPNEKKYLVTQMKEIKRGHVNHFIEFNTPRSFFDRYLGINPFKRLSFKDWLTFPQQALIEVTAGELYHDEIDFQKLRDKYKYFPDDIWLYLYANQWGAIGDEEMYMARSGEIGDKLGSSIIATRIVNNVMKLCFLMEKKYWPYSKWFGTAFSRLQSATELSYPLFQVVSAKTWEEREDQLSHVYEIIARKHNELKLTKQMSTETRTKPRPYKVIGARYFYDELAKKFSPQLKDLKYPLGSLDQFIAHSRINHINHAALEFKKVIK